MAQYFVILKQTHSPAWLAVVVVAGVVVGVGVGVAGERAFNINCQLIRAPSNH